MSTNEDIKALVSLGLNADRLAKHSDDEISMALCAVQESGRDAELISLLGDDGAATAYAESALGW